MIKKLILVTLLPLTLLLGGEYVMKKGQPLKRLTTVEAVQPVETKSKTSTLKYANYTPRKLPPKSKWYDVTKAKNIVCNGSHDDTRGFQALIKNRSVTNWYIAPGKTCKFFNIKVKSHLKAIFGGGKIIAKGNRTPYNGLGSHTGVFLMDSEIDGFLIDNIDFSVDSKGWGNINLWPNNGMIHLGGKLNTKNIEIRNCNVDVTKFPMNFIKGYINQKGNKKLSNLVIINNTIRGFKQFAIEILGGQHNRTFSKRPASGIKIIRNKFIGHPNSRLRRCISMPFLFFGKGMHGLKDGTESYIAENWFVDVEWGMETTSSSGIYVHNNLFTGKTMQAWHDIPERYIKGKGTYRNYYYHNVVIPNPTAIRRKSWNGSYIGVGAGSQIYENYIGTAMRLSKLSAVKESTVKGINIYNNIFSVEEANGVNIEKAVTFAKYPVKYSIFKNNKFFLGAGVTGIFNRTTSSFSNNTILKAKPVVPKKWGLQVAKSKIGAQ